MAPRYRNIHTQITRSYDLAETPDFFTNHLWTMFFVILDREGRGYDKASWIRSEAYKMFDPERVPDAMIETAMSWFVERGMIIRYEVGGRKYFCIPAEKWKEYQPGACKEAESTIPPYAELRRVSQSSAEKSGENLPEFPLNADAYADTEADAKADAKELAAPVAQSGAAGGVVVCGADQAEQRSEAAGDLHQTAGEVKGEGVGDAEKQSQSNPTPALPVGRGGSKSDPRTGHPAIQLIKLVTGQYPAKGGYDLIIRKLGDNPSELKFRKVYEVWCARGNKPTNFEGMLDWYAGTVPPPGKSGGAAPANSNRANIDRSKAAVEQYIREQEDISGPGGMTPHSPKNGSGPDISGPGGVNGD